MQILKFSPVLQVFGLHLCHLSTREVKHLLAEELQNDHVVLAQAFAGAARSNNITDKCGPVFRPLLLQNLNTHTLQNLEYCGRCVDVYSEASCYKSLTHLTCTNIILSFPMYTFSFCKEAEDSINKQQ